MRTQLLLVFLAALPAYARDSLSEMKRDLRHAEKELQIAQSRVLHLRESIARKEIARLQHEIKEFRGTEEERLDFYEQSRHSISSIMNEVPNCLDEAQKVLDQILVKITELKEAPRSEIVSLE